MNLSLRFVLTRRMRDMSILSKEGILDASAMAYRLLLREESRCGIMTDIGLVDGPSAARQYGTVVLRNQGQVDGTKSGIKGSSFSAGNVKGLSMELPLADMVSARLSSDWENAVSGGRRQAVGLGRWCYHLSTMRGESEGCHRDVFLSTEAQLLSTLSFYHSPPCQIVRNLPHSPSDCYFPCRRTQRFPQSSPA